MTEHSSAQDALNGLHIIAAVTQQAVNYQFAQLHKREILPQRLDLKLADTGLELKAELASPLVYFDLVTDHRSALFVLRMPKGVFSFWDGIGPNAKQKSVEFEDWSYAFTVALDMQALAAAAIAAHAELRGPSTRARLRRPRPSLTARRSLRQRRRARRTPDLPQP